MTPTMQQTDGRLTSSDRPRPGGGAPATSAASKPWTMPVKGIVRVAGKSEKMTIDLAKVVKRNQGIGSAQLLGAERDQGTIRPMDAKKPSVQDRIEWKRVLD
jgi:hypothetical protein